MSFVVVDASALGAMIFAEPEAAQVMQRLDGRELAGPLLLWFEMASICLKKLRANPGAEDVLLANYADFLRLPIAAQEVDHLSIPLLASSLGLSAYDACYVWLASRDAAELVTLDRRLARAARKAARR